VGHDPNRWAADEEEAKKQGVKFGLQIPATSGRAIANGTVLREAVIGGAIAVPERATIRARSKWGHAAITKTIIRIERANRSVGASCMK